MFILLTVQCASHVLLLLLLFYILPWPVYVQNLHLVRNGPHHNLSVLMCTSKKTPCLSSFLLEILANSLIQKEVMQIGIGIEWPSQRQTVTTVTGLWNRRTKNVVKTRKTLPAYRLILLFNWGGCMLFF